MLQLARPRNHLPGEVSCSCSGHVRCVGRGMRCFRWRCRAAPTSLRPSFPPPCCVQVDVAQVQNFRRSILDFRLEQLPSCAWGGRELLQLHIRGTAFLWHQVHRAGSQRECHSVELHACTAAAAAAHVRWCACPCSSAKNNHSAAWPATLVRHAAPPVGSAGALHGGGAADGGARRGAARGGADAAGHAALPPQAAVQYGIRWACKCF